jgi:hypothetical protein
MEAACAEVAKERSISLSPPVNCAAEAASAGGSHAAKPTLTRDAFGSDGSLSLSRTKRRHVELSGRHALKEGRLNWQAGEAERF